MTTSCHKFFFHFYLVPVAFILILEGPFYLILILSTVVEKLVEFYIFYILFTKLIIAVTGEREILV